MNTVNAIAKARFGTAKPQRIQLHKGGGLLVELLCMEAGQKLSLDSGQWVHYVVTGKASLTEGGQTTELPTGQLAAASQDRKHTVANVGEGRLVILAAARTG